MKTFILISSLLFLTATCAFAQQRKFFVFPPDSLKQLPQIEDGKPDTLRYYTPGDTIPKQLWENYLKAKKGAKNKVFIAPQDNMPIVVPPDHTFSLIVVKPDSTVHYHLRNFGTEKIVDTPVKPVK